MHFSKNYIVYFCFMETLHLLANALNKTCEQQHVRMNISCKNIEITNYLLN